MIPSYQYNNLSCYLDSEATVLFATSLGRILGENPQDEELHIFAHIKSLNDTNRFEEARDVLYSLKEGRAFIWSRGKLDRPNKISEFLLISKSWKENCCVQVECPECRCNEKRHARARHLSYLTLKDSKFSTLSKAIEDSLRLSNCPKSALYTFPPNFRVELAFSPTFQFDRFRDYEIEGAIFVTQLEVPHFTASFSSGGKSWFYDDQIGHSTQIQSLIPQEKAQTVVSIFFRKA